MPKNSQSHRSSCPLACGLDLLGDKWSLLIIRDLLLTNRAEYSHFLNAGDGISTNILSDRLDQLQKDKLISKKAHPDHGKKFIYSPTSKARALTPIIIELVLWADEHIEGAKAPRALLQKINDDKQGLIDRLMAGEILFEFDFNAEKLSVTVKH
jgi:DNA-binding HxlR family transcriptional regulator